MSTSLEGTVRVSQVPDASLSTCHSLMTPPVQLYSYRSEYFVLASATLKASPTGYHMILLSGLYQLSGIAVSLRPAEFPVYASAISFGNHLLHSCNTRYEWVVSPYSAGTFTPQEAPSCTWRTNAKLSSRPEIGPLDL